MQQIEGKPTPDALRARHILKAMATADAAVILPEADIQDPMHGASTLRVPAQCRRVAALGLGPSGADWK